MFSIHNAQKEDIDFLDKLESISFDPWVRNSRRSLMNSITSSNQVVLIAKTKENHPAGSAVLHFHKNTIRLYSIAIMPEFRKQGLGNMFVEHIQKLARQKGAIKITLEADETKDALQKWYASFGFEFIKTIPNYYKEGIGAVKMQMLLEKADQRNQKQNLIVVDNAGFIHNKIDNASFVTANEYISDKKYQDLKNARVFNLCSSYKYQSTGYYVSLLASARDHFILPTASAMSDYKNIALLRSITTELDDIIQNACRNMAVKKFSINIFFGKSDNARFNVLASKLYMLFEIPLMQASFICNEKWHLNRVTALNGKLLTDHENQFLIENMKQYFSRKRFAQKRAKSYLYDMAILINKEETNPPSCKKALEKFKKIAEQMLVYVEYITQRDINRLSEFDALFIRETTSVSNHTYQISRLAHAEGLIVIDDPWSIMRCSNKIFLFERMKLNKIKMPETIVLSKHTFSLNDVVTMGFPLILKQPDGAFSIGVNKVNNSEECRETVQEMFKQSDLVIAQQFLPSDFDWRIGVLDNKPLFACKYFMAQGHWQIYNWSNQGDVSGEYKTIAVEKVPENVIRTAIKAASLMGDGLYGVDLKEINGEVYVIEVNDNPNIDYGIEDQVLGDMLYKKIISSIISRIEVAKDYSKSQIEN